MDTFTIESYTNLGYNFHMNERFEQRAADLEDHLDEQINFIKSSAKAYDEGQESEAKRCAVSIRILVHDTMHSKSLLGQLGVLDRILFLDTVSGVFPWNPLPGFGLVVARIGPDSKFIAPLEDSPERRWILFKEWWHGTVFIDGERNQISRKQLLLAVANQDGGAHVDPKLDQVYAKLTRQNSLGVHYKVNGRGGELQGAATASIRQMAYEVLTSLEEKIYISVGRNDPCPCGSGKKYKKCCLI